MDEPEAAVLIWNAGAEACPGYRDEFYLFHQHLLVHQAGGLLTFTTLHPEGTTQLRTKLAH